LLDVQNARDDVFDLGELLSSMSRQQIEDLWSSLSRKCASALLHLDEVENDVDSFVIIYIKSIFSTCWSCRYIFEGGNELVAFVIIKLCTLRSIILNCLQYVLFSVQFTDV